MLEGGHPQVDSVADNSTNHNARQHGSTSSNAERSSDFGGSHKLQPRFRKKDIEPYLNITERIKTEFPESKRVAPSFSEILVSFIFQPMIVYTGFTRLTIVKSRKARLIYASQAQEAFLHTVPLTMLIVYNFTVQDRAYALDRWCLVVSIFNLIEIFAESCLYQFFLNKNIDLERRYKSTSVGRIRDMSRICCIGVSFAIMFVFVGLYAFEKQMCEDGTYDYQKFQCLSC